MAQGTGITEVGLKISKQDFLNLIDKCQTEMNTLNDIVSRYNNAKKSLEQFIQSDDIAFELMKERIDENVKAAKKSYNALQATKVSLETTVNNMETMGAEVQNTLREAIGAAGSAINAALQIEDVL